MWGLKTDFIETEKFDAENTSFHGISKEQTRKNSRRMKRSSLLVTT